MKHLVKFVFRRTWKNHKITHLICYDTWKNLDKVTQFLLCEINVLLTNYYLCTYFEEKKLKFFLHKNHGGHGGERGADAKNFVLSNLITIFLKNSCWFFEYLDKYMLHFQVSILSVTVKGHVNVLGCLISPSKVFHYSSISCESEYFLNFTKTIEIFNF